MSRTSLAGHELTLSQGPVEIPEGPPAETVFDSVARVGARECRVRSISAPGRDVLVVSGAGTFSLPHGVDRIDIDPEPGAGADAVEQALLGPAAALALARRGVFVLHASAVVLGNGVVGFLGESGAGKSTLARLLAAEGLTRAADDLLAVTLTPGSAEALPHFPQLKLGAAEMEAIQALEPRYPLLALYDIAPGDEVSAVDMTGANGAIALIQQTVAGKLFDTELMAASFGFAAQLAARVPVRRLRLPRKMSVGKAVADLLAERTRS